MHRGAVPAVGGPVLREVLTMPRSRIVCCGWGDAAGGDHHPCGKVLGCTEVPEGRDSHGMCADCFRKHMASARYTQEQIEQALRDAGLTE